VGNAEVMEDFDHGVEDNLERTCAVCGTQLTQAEMHAAREAGGPFLCSTHADEQAPAAVEEAVAGDEPNQPEGSPPPLPDQG
jgi:hypothetical protein